MSDLSSFLPLSQRNRNDESGVTSNWSRQLGMILLRVAEVLESCDAEQWSAPSMQQGFTVREVAHELARTSVARSDRRTTAALDDAALAARLRELAVARMSGRHKANVRQLGRALVAAYDIGHGVRQPIVVDPVTTGAVALARSLSAPTPIRAVVRGRTLVATDAGWRLGRGPELPGTAAAIILFLYGRGGVPDSGQNGTGSGG